VRPVSESLTDALCTRCGLCCDGSLLADVELSGAAEITRVRVLGLRVDDDSEEPLMLLPCSGLKGTRCTVYEHRPKVCRSFECGLLTSARRGKVSVAQALVHIDDARSRIMRVKRLLDQAGGYDRSLPLLEATAEALSATGHPALEAEVTGLDALLQRVFLARGR